MLYQGIMYKAVADPENSCEGCAFLNASEVCFRSDNYCDVDRIIWKEVNKQESQNEDSLNITEILEEINKAVNKFPTWPTDPLHALAVLGEEYGELTKDVLQLTYEPHKTNLDNVKIEAIQTAAMAIRFYLSLNKYEYKQSEQHSQNI